MLSVAMPWDLASGEPDASGEAAAADAVGAWRAARRALLKAGGESWGWAGSAEGAETAREILGRVDAWERFSPTLVVASAPRDMFDHSLRVAYT